MTAGARLRAQPSRGCRAAGAPQVAMWLKHTRAAPAGPGSAPGRPRAGGQRSCAGRSLLRRCSREEFAVPVRGTASTVAAGRGRFNFVVSDIGGAHELVARSRCHHHVLDKAANVPAGRRAALPCPRLPSSGARALLPSSERCIGCCLRQLRSFSVLQQMPAMCH